MQTELERWVAQSDENRKHYAQEGLILTVSEEIWHAMERRDVNKQRLSELLGTGKSYVTQVLSGARNMTLRTLSDMAEALGQRVEVRLVNKEDQQQWTSVGVVWSRQAIQIDYGAANDYHEENLGLRA